MMCAAREPFGNAMVHALAFRGNFSDCASLEGEWSRCRSVLLNEAISEVRIEAFVTSTEALLDWTLETSIAISAQSRLHR